jgi:hypothetical protein
MAERPGSAEKFSQPAPAPGNRAGPRGTENCQQFDPISVTDSPLKTNVDGLSLIILARSFFDDFCEAVCVKRGRIFVSL